LYNSDSLSPSSPRPWFRDVAGGSFTDFDPPDTIFIGTPPNPTIQGFVFESLWTPSWGPDVTGDGIPDSLVAQAFTFFGSSSQRSIGLYKLPSSPPQNAVQQWLADSSATQPDWSPDGQHIVFADTNPTGDRDIWIIRADSKDRSTARRITRGPADDSQPRFSPDGQSIFFVSNRADRYGLNGTFPTERRGTNIWSVTRFDRP
ncbi:MAG TPA: hypothetical protein VFT32_07295, partial [Candidatus Eisenbacteria bacterium]|nr:hypothetical protein [Candidatus Eisenbacteria bacterium]